MMTDFTAVALDIETANLDMDAEGLAFDDPQGWRISCVKTVVRNRARETLKCIALRAIYQSK